MEHIVLRLDDTEMGRKLIQAISAGAETPAQKLWREVYVAHINRGESSKYAESAADTAMRAFRERQL